MPDYKLCFLTDEGEVRAFVEFSAMDDPQAISLSLDAAGQRHAELLRDSAPVARLAGGRVVSA